MNPTLFEIILHPGRPGVWTGAFLMVCGTGIWNRLGGTKRWGLRVHTNDSQPPSGSVAPVSLRLIPTRARYKFDGAHDRYGCNFEDGDR